MPQSIAFFCLFISASICAQVGGETTYRFLSLVTSPQQAALGGKILTNVNYDVTQALVNPATINSEMNRQLSLNYSSYLGSINYGTAAYAQTLTRGFGTIHGGVSYINYGTFEGYDEKGNATGDFSGSETAASVGYALQIGFSDFYIGSTLKAISSRLEQYSSFGAAIDLGLLYNNQAIDFQATLVVRNIGTQITTYAGQKEQLPFEINFGISQTLQHVPIRWYLTLENLQEWPIARPNPAHRTTDLDGNQNDSSISFLGQVARHSIMGIELLPQRHFNIRLGYNFRRGSELRILNQRNFSGLSAGFSVKMNALRFSYAYAKYSSAGNSNFFGIQIDLNK